MNGPIKIYRTKPFVKHDIQLSLPNCMYNLKNINETRNGMVERSPDHVSSPKKNLDIFNQNNQNIPDMALLEARQKQILHQLEQLRKQMLTIKANLNVTAANGPTSQSATCEEIKESSAVFESPPNQQQVNDQDFVVYCSPMFPPYSLQVVQKLWRNSVNFCVKSYLHSTVASLPPQAKQLATSLESFQSSSTSSKLNVRLIWKEVGARTQLVVSRLPIIGEVNILRYLGRISSCQLNYERHANPHEVDTLLDTCYRIVTSKTKTERAGLLQILNKSLGKTQWLLGRNQMSIADIAAFSTLKQIDQSEIGANLSKWLQLIEKIA